MIKVVIIHLLWSEDNFLSGKLISSLDKIIHILIFRLAFCVTINKGQGQENERVGLDLPSSVFAHGQLYTGMSRGKRGSMVKVRIADTNEGYTDNIT